MRGRKPPRSRAEPAGAIRSSATRYERGHSRSRSVSCVGVLGATGYGSPRLRCFSQKRAVFPNRRWRGSSFWSEREFRSDEASSPRDPRQRRVVPAYRRRDRGRSQRRRDATTSRMSADGFAPAMCCFFFRVFTVHVKPPGMQPTPRSNGSPLQPHTKNSDCAANRPFEGSEPEGLFQTPYRARIQPPPCTHPSLLQLTPLGEATMVAPALLQRAGTLRAKSSSPLALRT